MGLLRVRVSDELLQTRNAPATGAQQQGRIIDTEMESPKEEE